MGRSLQGEQDRGVYGRRVSVHFFLKQASPFKTTFVVELSNAVETMYVPTRAAYAGGSYEVTNSAFEVGSGEMLVEAAIRLLREMAREQNATPKRNRASLPPKVP